ncbi:MAG: PLP-dependent aspartate aminotransferase family protein [Flavobacteriales bacterium]|jgi:cystathionine gamma-lyase|tara:strand:+ start:1701 stop:2858 length:1158 start_codon:yes stop_codon:yes gene_type:complete
MENNKLHKGTRAIHVGNKPDEITGSVIPPIYQTSTFVQSSPGVHKGYEYTRSHNPTRTRLEECLASLENANYCMVTSSGMSAVSLIFQSFPQGTKILCGDDVYGGTYRLLNTIYNDRFEIKHVNTSNTASVLSELASFKPNLVWLESPTNPMLQISDIKAISDASHAVNAKVVVDNTFMSPYFQNPLDLGADMVLHSLTKYINGHSDVVGGAVMLNNKEQYDKLWYLQNSIGPSQSPFDSWLVLRGIKTLALRMRAHEENAQEIARFLEAHPKVEKVIYPGLASHPQHELAKQQMSGFGGMLSLYLKGGLKESTTFLEEVNLFVLAESLGGVESLIEHPAIMTHASVPAKERAKLGIADNFIRISVGVEAVEDLKADLANALDQL